MSIIRIENKYWMLIYAHYPYNFVRFTDEKEALYSDDPLKFSRLNKIHSKYKINGRYEFLLRYPQGAIKWYQTNSPLDEYELSLKDNKVEGFDLIDYPKGYKNSFGGLARTEREQCGCINTFLKGNQIDYNWWYSIGQYPGCCNNWQGNYTAGPRVESDSSLLYMRIDAKFVQVEFNSFNYIKRFTISLFVLLVL